jgi:hypothetical protein
MRVPVRPRAAFGQLLVAAAFLSGCNDSPGRLDNPLRPSSARRGFTHEDSVARGIIRSQDKTKSAGIASASMTSDNTVSVVSLTPGNFQGFNQPETIVGIVSGPVGSISVSGQGAIKCTGTYGTIIGYDANGVELGRQDLSLIDPSDCSPPDNPDDVTFGAQGTLTVTTGIIAKFEITPMSPLEFPVFDQTGHASATYTITLAPGSAPVLSFTCSPTSVIRTRTVTCTAVTGDGSAFTPKRLRSTAADGTVIVDSTLASSSTTQLTWPGVAIVSTNVELTATVGTKDTVVTSSFSVIPRIGQLAGWMDEDFPDTGFPATPPATTWSKATPPFTTKYPGFDFSADRVIAPEGALGQTVFMYPATPGYGKPKTGPNTGVIFFLSVPWQADTRYSGIPVGIYLEQSVNSADPFYQKQKGPPPKCTQTDMASIATVLRGHEVRHWTTARTTIAGVDLVKTLDSATVLPGGAQSHMDDVSARVRQAYADSITSANTQTHQVTDVYPTCELKK